MSTTSTMTPQETRAKDPFNDPKADIILQSSDGVHFCVFKNILSFASPIFSDMFSIPLPTAQPPNSGDEIQVVSVSENSEALDLSLRHIYPVPTPDTMSLRDASILAEFAHKYQVDALEKPTRHYLMDNLNHDPVGVYAIAVAYGYRSIGKSATQACLSLPFSRLESTFEGCTPAENFAALFRYHVACGEAASKVASDRAWFSSLGQSINFITNGQRGGCGLCATQDFMDLADFPAPAPATMTMALLFNQGKRYAPLCLWNYLYRSTLVLARHPTAAAVAKDDFVLQSYNCRSCPADYRRQLLEFSKIFGREIRKALEQVPLPEPVSAHGT